MAHYAKCLQDPPLVQLYTETAGLLMGVSHAQCIDVLVVLSPLRVFTSNLLS